jgi:hypothetical protein
LPFFPFNLSEYFEERNVKKLFTCLLTLLLVPAAACTPTFTIDTTVNTTVYSTSTATAVVTTVTQTTTTLTTTLTAPPAVSVAFPLEHLNIHPAFPYYHYASLGTQVHVMADYQSLPGFLQFSIPATQTPGASSMRDKLFQVDFTRNFVVCAYMGAIATDGHRVAIEKVWQEGNTLFVQADFNKDAPSTSANPLPNIRIPFDAAVISREVLHDFGELSVVLLNQEVSPVAISACAIPEQGPSSHNFVTYLPVQLPETESGPYPTGLTESEMSGELVLKDGSIWFSHSPISQYLVVWPPGFTVELSRGDLHVGNTVGRVAGIHEIDREVYMGMQAAGYVVDAGVVEKYTGSPVPPGVTGPFWLITEIDNPMT